MKNTLSPDAVSAITKAVESALSTSRVSFIQPRRMTEHAAAAYCGRSFYWLRNLRRADDERLQNGGDRIGPPYFREGRTPFYFREDLDQWLGSLKEVAAHE